MFTDCHVYRRFWIYWLPTYLILQTVYDTKLLMMTQHHRRTTHNVPQPWQTDSFSKKSTGSVNKNLSVVIVAALLHLYKALLPIKATKKIVLDDMFQYIPPTFVPFYQELKWNQEISKLKRNCNISFSIYIFLLV